MVVGVDVTLTEIRTYEIGRESGERRKSAERVSFVPAHWFSYAGRADPKDFEKYLTYWLKFSSWKVSSKAPTKTFRLSTHSERLSIFSTTGALHQQGCCNRCLSAFQSGLMCCRKYNAEPPHTPAVGLNTNTWQEHLAAWHWWAFCISDNVCAGDVKAFFVICHSCLFCDLFNLVLSGLVVIECFVAWAWISEMRAAESEDIRFEQTNAKKIHLNYWQKIIISKNLSRLPLRLISGWWEEKPQFCFENRTFYNIQPWIHADNWPTRNWPVTVRRSLLLTSVTGCPKFRMSGHLLKGLAVKCSRQLPFSYQFAGVGQENQRNVDKLTLNVKWEPR